MKITIEAVKVADPYTRAAPPIRSVYRAADGFAAWEIETGGWLGYDASLPSPSADGLRCLLSRRTACGPCHVALLRLDPETDAERAFLAGCRVFRADERGRVFFALAADPCGVAVAGALYEPSAPEAS